MEQLLEQHTSSKGMDAGVLQALQQSTDVSGTLLRAEDLVYASQFNEWPAEVPQTSDVLSAEIERMIVALGSGIHPKVRDAITSGLYKMQTSQAASYFPLDDRALMGLQLEVFSVLLGLRTVPEFEQAMRAHPILSSEEGAEFAQEIRQSLFAELALYIQGMGDDEFASSAETLSSALQKDADIQARLQKLPEAVQNIIRSSELEQAFTLAQRKYRIEPPTAQTLANQALRVMVGLTTMNDFKVGVTRDAGIPPATLDALFLDIEQTLFKPVRTTIMQALEHKMGSLPNKDENKDPYQTPVK